jgi:Ca2+-binding EF-hand superfamily protein
MILDEANLILSATPPGRPPVEFSESLFRRLDLDANDYLEAAEARSGGVDFLPPFDVLDVDKDDRVYLAEWQAAVVPPLIAQSLPFRMEIREEGRQLFELIDGSRDGRLTRREFLEAAQSLPDWDRDSDQALADRELPDVWRATGRFGLADFLSTGILATGFARNMAGESVPAWFTAMDRNSDGDISAREFPGSVIRFRALDRDGDGLISPAEATLARPAP